MTPGLPRTAKGFDEIAFGGYRLFQTVCSSWADAARAGNGLFVQLVQQGYHFGPRTGCLSPFLYAARSKILFRAGANHFKKEALSRMCPFFPWCQHT